MNHSTSLGFQNDQLGGEAQSITLGHTEPSSGSDIERLCGEINALKEENRTIQHRILQVETENGQLKTENLCFRRELEDERKRRQLVEDDLQESRNHLNDMRFQMRLKVDETQNLTRENLNLKTRLSNYENDQIRDIRRKSSKRFKSNPLKECRRCKSVITEEEESCWYHPEKPIRHTSYTKENPILYWRCCCQSAKREPTGCYKAEQHDYFT